MTNFLEKGRALITDAQNAEQQGRYQDAINSYSHGIEWLHAAIKYEDNATIKATLTGKVGAYLERAEKLKEIMERKEPQTSSPIAVSSTAVTAADKHDAETASRARALVLGERPAVHWADVAGLESVKRTLRQAAVLPLCMPHLFADGRVEPWKGVLLFGPPGTGKTLLAKAVATESSGATFMNVRIADIMNKYVGESERNVKAIFQLARQEAPTVVFIDEIDCLMGTRGSDEHDVSRKVKNQLLQELDGLGSEGAQRILVLAATNRPWDLDDAFLRRMQRRVYIPLPDAEARGSMFAAHAGKSGFSLDAAAVQTLVEATENWSGSDVATLVRAAQNHQLEVLDSATHFRPQDGKLYACAADAPDAVRMTLAELIGAKRADNVALPPVTLADFQAVLPTTRPSTTVGSLGQFEKFAETQGSGKA